MKQEVYNLKGEKVKNIELKKDIFESKINHDLIYQVVVALSSNKRKNTAHTKTRSDVRGGGRKPWRQKGTGHARAGSIRSPIFRGGGVTFGPRNERNYTKKVNKKARIKAFIQVLTSKVKDKETVLFEEFKLTKPSTKKFSKLIGKFKHNNKSILFVTEEKNENLKKSLNNIEKAKYRNARDLNCLDLLNHKYCYFDVKAIDYYHKKYSN